MPPATPSVDGPACPLALRRRGLRQASGYARRGGPNGFGVVRLVVSFTLLVLFHGQRARAADAEPVRVDYHADDGCPDSDAFLRAVWSRTSRARPANEREHEPARTFHVVLTRDAAQVHGSFSVTGADDAPRTSSPRAIEGASCDEVFDALVMFAALSVDADAKSRANTADDASASSLSAAPRVTPDPAHVDAPRAARRVIGREPARRLHLAAGVGVGLVSAGTAKRAGLAESFFETRWQRAMRTGIDVSPTLRATLSVFGGDSARNELGYASLHWATARFDVCPFALVGAGVFRLRPCASASGGVLWASGREIAQPASRHLPWWTLGGVLRAEWEPNAFALELSAGFEAPLQRSQLYFEPATALYTPPPLFERIALGAAYHFL